MDFFIRGFITVLRYILPVLSVLMLWICAVELLKKRVKPYKLVLTADDEKEIPISSGEYVIGSASDCDIVLKGTKESHGVLSVSNNYMTIRPIGKNKIGINRKSIKDEKRFAPDDVITMGDREFSVSIKKSKGKATEQTTVKKTIAFALLNLIQFFVLLSMCFAYTDRVFMLMLCFFALIVGQWIYLFITRFLGVFLEIPILFLVTLGLSVTAHSSSANAIKHIVCFFAGTIISVFLAKLIQVPKIAMSFKGIALIVGVAFFVVNILYGVIYNGSQNWLNFKGVSIQPSEFIKVILVYLSGATADRLTDKKDIISFSAFAVFCLAVLAYLSDFGTLLIYAFCLTAILFIRIGSMKLLGIMTGIAVLGGGLVVLLFPYVSKRIFLFGTAFDNAYDSGYQQTRAMIAAASGGLFGVGGGKGTLVKVSAYDTDIVFGLIVEEWGLIIGLCILFCFLLFAIYAVKTLSVSSSGFYSITCCAAAVLLLAQTSLNVFGSLDMLPFTGVTLPFVSNGGSSLIACTVLMTFFRAALRDERIILMERRRKGAKN